MTSYAGPNGRLYRRRSNGRWIALTILSVTMIGLVMVGREVMGTIFHFVGL
jgi:hypothetical protein